MGHDTHDDHGPKGKFDQIFKTAKSLKLERPQLPKLVSMCFTSTSTCMNFLIQFYFLTSMVQREIMHIGLIVTSLEDMVSFLIKLKPLV